MALWKNVTRGLDPSNALMIRQTEGIQLHEKSMDLNEYNFPSVLHHALYYMMNKNQPITIGDNLDQYIKHGYCKNSDWYAIVNYIMMAATRYLWTVKRQTKGGKLEDANENDLYGLLQTYVDSEFVQSNIAYLCNVGNSYMYGLGPESGVNRGKVQELDVLPAHYTEPVFGSISNPVGGYKLRMGDATKIIPAEAVCHLKFWNPDVMNSKNMQGMAPLKAASLLLQQSNAAFESNAISMTNQGPGYLLTKDGEGNMTPEQADGIATRLYRKAWGVLNRHKPVVANGGLRAVQLGLSPADLKILESQNMNFEQMCRVLNFPVTIADSKSATLDNMKVSERLLYAQCVGPKVEYMRSKLQKWLVPAYGSDLIITLDDSNIEALQEDKNELATWMQKVPEMTINEKREMLGLEPLPDGNGFLIPVGMSYSQTLSEMTEPPVDEETMKGLRERVYG